MSIRDFDLYVESRGKSRVTRTLKMLRENKITGSLGETCRMIVLIILIGLYTLLVIKVVFITSQMDR